MIEQIDSPYFIPAIAIVAFIVGLLIGRALKNNKYQSEIEKCQIEKSRLSNHIKNESISFTEDNTIKAVQTRGRSGMALETDLKVATIKKSNTTPKLDFNSIGIASEEAKDDLKKIEGIGAFIEKKLNSIGIYKYDQLSRITDKDIEVITELIEFFPGRIKRDDWRGKAQQLKENLNKKEGV
ncbi:hypothetical protein HX109_14755 [Galbibacter sp. BG1]|uniref:hypothetical protein n=1 Tax=Galbibacter sp. BG1 TaxID=1170699 RepID=UPI0015BE9DFD|nr:hypothetical protein [Galbibacter sp. BG1]QLE02761.1 hypothetical protein HX109_14755 [Galbibacter sp. BG1]